MTVSTLYFKVHLVSSRLSQQSHPFPSSLASTHTTGGA
jgi:hypothetical protein